ncbi:hypothetical protein PMAYCL1PPCAC_20442, partial [Pristionchus mayeri]
RIPCLRDLPLAYQVLDLASAGNIINVADTTDRYIRQNSFYCCFQLILRDVIDRSKYCTLLHSDEDFLSARLRSETRISVYRQSSHLIMSAFVRFLISSRLSILKFLRKFTRS